MSTTLAFATDRFKGEPGSPPHGADELLAFLLSAFEGMGHQPLHGERSSPDWGAEGELQIDGCEYVLLVARVGAEDDPALWWAQISPVDTRSLWQRLRGVQRATHPRYASELLEDAVRTIPGVRVDEWVDEDHRVTVF